MIEQPTKQIDPVLLPYLNARSEAEAGRCLTSLISGQAEPLIKNIVGYKLRACFGQNGQANSDEVEDTCSEALLHLLARLSDIKHNSREEHVITNFRGYVALTAYRACHDHLRRKYPQRYRLKNKLRYFLRHRAGFALWETDEGEWIGGFALWASQTGDVPRRRRGQELFEALPSFTRRFLPGNATDTSLDDLLTAIFKWVAEPVELDELVSIVAELWQVKDQAGGREAHSAATAFADLTDTRPSAIEEHDLRAYLAKLWDEVKQLSPGHCAALLLNLRDAQNRSAVELFLFTGTATFEQLAEVISRSESWLAEVWNDLPLDDSTIARHLGLSRQQVINLRKSARRRLLKRIGRPGF
ncbi:MAG TPA: hypothetical protein VGW12_04985 [Pyrinomonadaceae bacterium]|nr:hypothetical protein [Pyrinomonadaceae bacterium]